MEDGARFQRSEDEDAQAGREVVRPRHRLEWPRVHARQAGRLIVPAMTTDSFISSARAVDTAVRTVDAGRLHSATSDEGVGGRRSNAEVLRALRAAALTAGKCLECRARPARPGRRTCDECARRRKARRARYASIGLCGCGRRPRGEFALCAKCRSDQRKASRRQRRSHAASGLCIWRSCTAPAASGRAMCPAHLLENTRKSTALSYDRLARGECVRCGQRHPDPTWRCAKCARRAQELAKARREAAP